MTSEKKSDEQIASQDRVRAQTLQAHLEAGRKEDARMTSPKEWRDEQGRTLMAIGALGLSFHGGDFCHGDDCRGFSEGDARFLARFLPEALGINARRWCSVCGIFTIGKSCPDHPDAPSLDACPEDG